MEDSRDLKKYKNQQNVFKYVVNAGVLMLVLVVVCFIINAAKDDYSTAGKQDVTSTDYFIEVDVTEMDVAETEVLATENESESTNKEAINYIYERTSWDEEKVTIFGEFDADEVIVEELNELIEDYPREIGFKAVTIDGSRGVSYNSSGEFFVASAVKAPYLLYACKQIDEGNGSPDEEMQYTGDYYHEGSGVMRYFSVGTTFTLEEIMRYTMRKSDNVGYNMCIARWGKEGYNKLMQELGCQSFVMEEWSPWIHNGKVEEMLIIWNAIYEYMNQGSEGARLLYDSCTYQGVTSDYNFMKNVLPEYIVSQKYGWTDEGYGNAAIVYGEMQNYLIVIFMDSSGNAQDQRTYNNIVRLVNELLDD